MIIIIIIIKYRAGIERPIEKSGAILTRVRVPSATRDFSPRVNFQCVRTTPCAIASINVRAYVKNAKHRQPYHCLDTRKYQKH